MQYVRYFKTDSSTFFLPPIQSIVRCALSSLCGLYNPFPYSYIVHAETVYIRIHKNQ